MALLAPTGLAPEGEKEDDLLGEKQKEDELQWQQYGLTIRIYPGGSSPIYAVEWIEQTVWFGNEGMTLNKFRMLNAEWFADKLSFLETLSEGGGGGGSYGHGGGGDKFSTPTPSHSGNRTGTNQSTNGIPPGSYAGSMNLGTPKSWKTQDIANTVEPANAKLSTMLHDCNYQLEVGYWLINDANNNLTAHFYYGHSDAAWVSNLGNITLKISEMLVGFTHVHIADVQTSPQDANTIAKIIFGKIEFANRPDRNDKLFGRMIDKSFFGTIFFDQESRTQYLQYFGWSKNNTDVFNGIVLMLNATSYNLGYADIFKHPFDFGLDYLRLERNY